MNTEQTVIIALGGWILALTQFVLSFLEKRKNTEDELLEKTLGYFERGTQARSIALSLIEGVWLKKKKRLDVIVPILVSQLYFLLTEAEKFGQEDRNLIRLLRLLEKSVDYSANPHEEKSEILNTFLVAIDSPRGIRLTPQTARTWYGKFNGGDTKAYDNELSTQLVE